MTNPLRCALLAILLAACNPPASPPVAGVLPAAATPPPSFTVIGTATLDVEPDTADLHVTVSGQASKPAAATHTARARQQTLVAGLVALGIEERDIKLSQLHLAPVWDEKYTRVVGYQAGIDVTASTHDFDELGSMMEAAADAGATGISSSFRADLPALKRKVRDLALTAAKDKAAQIGASLGFQPGKIIAVDENGATSYYDQTIANVRVEEPAQSQASTSAELQPLTLSISVTYQLA
jgi:uncharacterized protein YggE